LIAGGNHLPIWTAVNAVYLRAMALQRADGAFLAQVPELDAGIARAAYQDFGVTPQGKDRQGAHCHTVTLQS